MSFVDELRRDPSEAKNAELNRWIAYYVNNAIGALRETCVKNRTKGSITGYVLRYQSDGYDEWRIIERLPETNPAVVEKQRNTNLKKSKYSKYGGMVVTGYPVSTEEPYRDISLAVSETVIKMYCQQLREAIRKLGFTKYSVTSQRVPNVVLEIIPSKILNRVRVKSSTKGYVYLIKLEVHW